LQVRTLRGHSGGVYSVSFSADGNWIVSGSVDERVKIWDAATGAEVRRRLGLGFRMASADVPSVV
jgi:WD40 repeat protein